MNDKLILSLLSLACNDYIDARLLVRQNRLLNGGHLSSLAAERLLKSVILACGSEPKYVHLDQVDKLVNQIRKAIPDFQDYIDMYFLRYLGRIFLMRYYPDQNDDNISISRNKLLWQVDKLFDQVHSYLRFEPPDTQASYVKEKNLHNPLILGDNQWLLGKRKMAELETLPDFLESIYRMTSGITVVVRKEFPKTFTNCKIGEELKIALGKP